MSNQLIKYEAACRALAECKSVDEAKTWADKAAAMQAYGRMANDRTLEVDAAEIRIRAERRLGEMIAMQKADGGLSTGSRGQLSGKSVDGLAVVTDDRQKNLPKLSDAGISKDLSSRAQKLAAVPAEEFEDELAAKRERDIREGARVSARLEAAGARKMAEAKQEEEAEEDPKYTELDAAHDQIIELQAELVVARMGDIGEDEKEQAAQLIKELNAEIKKLKVVLKAVELARDSLMEENAQMKKQMAMQRKEIDKLKKG